MKRTSHIAILILVVTLLGSCTKVLEIDDSGAKDLLVLNGLPSAGNRAFVFFSHSHFFLDSEMSYPVDGASLTLNVNGVPYAPDSVSGSKYFFPYTCQPDDSLRIDIASPAGNLHAKTYVPRYPVIDGFSVVDFASSSFNFYLARYTLSDYADHSDYYYLTVTVRDSGMRFDTWTQTFDTVDTVHSTYFLVPYNEELTSNEVSPNAALGGYLYSSLISTDRLMDGQDREVSVFILHLIDTNEVNDSAHVFKHWYDVTIESITPARLLYIVSASRNMGSVSFFTEQSQPYTNIQGGMGVFAGMARWRHSFDPDTLIHLSGSPGGIPAETVAAIARRQEQESHNHAGKKK